MPDHPPFNKPQNFLVPLNLFLWLNLTLRSGAVVHLHLGWYYFSNPTDTTFCIIFLLPWEKQTTLIIHPPTVEQLDAAEYWSPVCFIFPHLFQVNILWWHTKMSFAARMLNLLGQGLPWSSPAWTSSLLASLSPIFPFSFFIPNLSHNSSSLQLKFSLKALSTRNLPDKNLPTVAARGNHLDVPEKVINIGAIMVQISSEKGGKTWRMQGRERRPPSSCCPVISSPFWKERPPLESWIRW